MNSGATKNKKTKGKGARRARAFFSSPFFVGLTLTFMVAAFAADFYAKRERGESPETLGFASRLAISLDDKSIDFRLRDRGAKPGSPDVAVLAIDERALEQEGHWVWSREKIAKLIDRSFALGAKSIAFDFVFPEREPDERALAAERLKERLTASGSASPSLRSALELEENRLSPDGVFAESIAARADALTMGGYFDNYRLERKNRLIDFCLTRLASALRSEEKTSAWQAGGGQIEVEDDAKMTIPHFMAPHLDEYLGALQTNEAAAWLDLEPKRKQAIFKAFSDLGGELPPDDAAAALRLWAIGRFDQLLEALAPSLPAVKLPANRAMLDRAFATAAPQRELAKLQGRMQDTGELYCGRIFTDDDELLRLAAYRKRYSQAETEAQTEAGAEASAAAFKAISWKSAWDEAAETGTPHDDPDKLKTSKQEKFEDWLPKAVSRATENQIEVAGRLWTDIPELARAARHVGLFNAKQDLDGAIRRSILVARHGEDYYPSLALQAYLVSRGYKARLQIADQKAHSLTVIDPAGKNVMNVPVDSRGDLLIDYSGPRNMFAYVSAADVLNDDKIAHIEQAVFSAANKSYETQIFAVDKKEFMRGKILIFAATATGIYDLRVTPFDENFPGAETHANVVSNLLQAEAAARGAGSATANGASARSPSLFAAPGFLRTDSRERLWMPTSLVAFGAGLSALLAWLGPLAGLAIAATSIMAIYLVDKYFLFKFGIVVAVMFPLLLTAALYVVMAFYKYFVEERDKRELKGVFEKYVSPAIVAEVLADPDNVELGGKKMDLTVLFSDVRGFTTISELLDPRELADLLNSYLTPMTALVFEHKGTLDKYMGDAIMAFWGAPVHFPDHPRHACRCALAMLAKLGELQAEYAAQGLPQIDIGIGVNCGEMNVGNMGSNTVRSYTVMGDAVNLGSRLEGINKQYGTRIIVSEFVWARVKDEFVLREVDRVRVKGKLQPIKIFELIAEKTRTGELLATSAKQGAAISDSVVSESAKTPALASFAAGYAAYHERDFLNAAKCFREGLALDPGDACAKLYIERCENYLASPPPLDWDGVFDMKTK